MRRIAVVTTSRADYGLLRYIIKRLSSKGDASLQLVVSGSHLSRRFGSTAREIEQDGTPIAAKVPLPLAGDSGVDAARALAAAVAGFTRAFSLLRPDVVLLLGDRYETLAAAESAVLVGAVVGHLAGGEVTAGSLDEGWRHAITKIAHIHFPATRSFARRIRAMGEEPSRIHTVGSPGIEAIHCEPRFSRVELERSLGGRFIEPIAICTFHPLTADAAGGQREAAAFVAALARAPLGTIILTAPNADPGGRKLAQEFGRAARHDPRIRIFSSLGSRRYLSLLNVAQLMIGNSSSGLIESPSFGLPTVNIGRRQEGRLRARNVIDVPGDELAIGRAIRRALAPQFRASLRGIRNPYGDGRTSERVVGVLLSTPLDERIRVKHFVDVRS